MDVSSDDRCRRQGCQSWRCGERALQGRPYCENHCLQMKKAKMKRMAGKCEDEEEEETWSDSGGDKIVARRCGGGGGSGGLKRAKIKGGRSDDEASGTEVELNQILGRQQPKHHSMFKAEKINKKMLNTGVKLTKSGNTGEDTKTEKISKKMFNSGEKVSRKMFDSGEKVSKKMFNSGEKLPESGGQTNTVKDMKKTRGLVMRKSSTVNGLDKTNENKERVSLMCHQCMRNDKDGIVICSSCKRKRYCYECLAKWYPEKTREDVANACPFCCGNCNCKACLRGYLFVKVDKELDSNTKFQQLQHLLHKALPVLRHIYREQNSELEIEAKIRGIQLEEKDITRSNLGINERLYWL